MKSGCRQMASIQDVCFRVFRKKNYLSFENFTLQQGLEFNQEQTSEHLSKFKTSLKMSHRSFLLENPNIFVKWLRRSHMVAICNDFPVLHSPRVFKDLKSPLVLNSNRFKQKTKASPFKQII